MKKLVAVSLAVVALACTEKRTNAPTPPDVRATNEDPPPPAEKVSEGRDQETTRHIQSQIDRTDTLTGISSDLNVYTKNGVVTLEGVVSNKQASATLLSIANDAPGVTRVENKLVVKDY